eukprot:CAMPEP_0201516012 /NCGR_PEP_ID=MMETSP0161_2-20130828/7438_1 /ASSEMBLY_ACC=CAM_ASM_000251 /TAXON_ID=180227 /ORGANISM="Neoparamoeba aestuarina, Strain SoJaBio B1-5/56/2" /LENGTH=249 /DNA_ID=CAMNT_0047912993 /DNA_START=54 /DNA_END=800 /DNA_ORIENTATION=+
MANVVFSPEEILEGKSRLENDLRKGPHESSQIMAKLSDEERYSESRFARLDQWYETIKHLTFESEIFLLSKEESKAILRANEAGKMELLLREQEYREANPEARIFAGPHKFPEIRHVLSRKDQKALNGLEEKLDVLIQRMGGAAFVRTSGMSPKDAILGCQKLRTMMEKSTLNHMTEFPDASKEEQEDFDSLNWITLLSIAGQVKSGAEAIYLLSASRRTYSDISNTQLQDDACVQLIVRRWENIDPVW